MTVLDRPEEPIEEDKKPKEQEKPEKYELLGRNNTNCSKNLTERLRFRYFYSSFLLQNTNTNRKSLQLFQKDF